MQTSTVREWWQPEPAAPAAPAAPPATGDRERVGGRLAFAMLIAFTVILFAAPQERVPALAALRIALAAGVLAFLGYWLDRLLTARTAPPPSREVRLVFVLVAWATLTVPFSMWAGGSVDTLLEYLKSVLVFWLIGATLLTLGRLRLMAWTLSLLSIPLALTALSNYGGGIYDDGRVVGYRSGLAENPNDLALTLNIVLPLTVALARTARSKAARLGLAGVALLTAAGVVVTFSRGGFLTLVLVVLLVALSLLRGRGPIAWAGAAALLVAAVPLLPPGYGDRLATIVNVEADPTGSAQDRKRDMVAAIQVMTGHPVMGVGLGQDVLGLNEIRGETWMPVHNVYLQYGADLGVPGLVLFVAVLAAAYRGARRVEKPGHGHADPDRQDLATLAGAVRIGLAAFALAAMFHPVAYHFYFYYLAGLAVAVQRTADIPA
jgi:O-antigen ligase